MDEQKKRLYEMIVDYENHLYRTYPNMTDQFRIEMTVEHLLGNGVIVPPCKVGDVVFCHTYDHKEYAPIEVRSLGSLIRWVEDGDFGKWLFLTREEAEAALKERKGVKIMGEQKKTV